MDRLFASLSSCRPLMGLSGSRVFCSEHLSFLFRRLVDRSIITMPRQQCIDHHPYNTTSRITTVGMGKSRKAGQRDVKRRRKKAAAPLSDDLARLQGHQEQGRAEEEEEEPPKGKPYDPKQPLPNLGTHFAVLTNAVLKRITDAKTSDRLYDEFMLGAKTELIYHLKKTFCELLNFYNDPALTMPVWLAELPRAKTFYTEYMDVRLQNRKLQIMEDLREFVEEQGFFCTEVRACDSRGSVFYCVDLRLDVAKVSTTDAREHVEKRLLNLEYDSNV